MVVCGSHTGTYGFWLRTTSVRSSFWSLLRTRDTTILTGRAMFGVSLMKRLKRLVLIIVVLAITGVAGDRYEWSAKAEILGTELTAQVLELYQTWAARADSELPEQG